MTSQLLKNRKVWGVFVILVAILIAGFLLFDDNKNNSIETKKDKFFLQEDGKKLISASGEDLSYFLSSQAKKLNLTEKLALKMAQGIDGLNQDKSNLFVEGDVAIPDGEEIIQESIGDYSDEFVIKDELIDIGELVMSDDNSSEAVFSYYTIFRDTLFKYAEKLDIVSSIEEFTKDHNPKYILPIIGSITEMIEEMKRIKVPSDFLVWHKNILDAYIAEKSIFGAMVFAKDDPLRASIAVSLLSEIENELESLRQDLVVNMSQHGLSVRGE